MRFFGDFAYLVVLTVVLFIVVLVISKGLGEFNRVSSEVLNNVSAQLNVSVNISEYDLVEGMKPAFRSFDYVFIIAILAAFFGVFAYARSR